MAQTFTLSTRLRKVSFFSDLDNETVSLLEASMSPLDFAPGDLVFIDVPENNTQALTLARRHDLDEVFGCARMYYGPPPELVHNEIFGVTTFELG